MRRHGNLWEKIISPDNLYKAYLRARRGKRSRRSVINFEKDVAGNLHKIWLSLKYKTYTTSSYKTKTIYEPKQRDIYILPFFPDRIVQHALMQVLVPIWDGLMIKDSYACRENKGMHQASDLAMQYVRKYKYCLKADISKFYPSIDHDILLDIIRKKIKCKDTLWLLEDIIRSFPGVKNVPIGNYTSQWFGNLYMNELDQSVKHELKIPAYIRYCDDFVLFHNDKKKLGELQKNIEEFVNNKLLLKFSKSSVFPVTQGLDFLGYRHFTNKLLLRKSTAKRIQKRFKDLPILFAVGDITKEQYRSSIASTEGWLMRACSFNFKINIQLERLKDLLV